MPVKNIRGFYTGLSRAVEELYRENVITLAKDTETPDFDFDGEVFRRAAKWISDRGGFTPDMLAEAPAVDVIRETFRVLNTTISSSVPREVPAGLVGALENNAFVFSGFKTFHSLNEVGLSLKGEDGGIKPFGEFLTDVEKINEKYNRNYLYAEYNHAVTSSEMAVKWQDFERDGDRYDLQYRTAGDELVRADHQVLDGITLPTADPFWAQFLPPNGWNCRCTVVQVRRGKYPDSDSDKAVALGMQITKKPKLQMFRFNPGKELKLFPDKHPYHKAPKAVKKTVETLAEEIKTPQQAVDFINETQERREWFARGFKTLMPTVRKGVNGFTNMNGVIALTPKRLDRVLAGMTKLRRGKRITFEEADALATLWHEITHNRNKKGNMHTGTITTQYMELANELVARNTLPEFYRSIGGKMQHPDLMDNRDSTGYNTMVRNYCALIKATNADFSAVVESVKKHLFEERYDQQADGLIKALQENGARKPDGTGLKATEIKSLVKCCLEYDYSEKLYEAHLQNLLVKE